MDSTSIKYQAWTGNVFIRNRCAFFIEALSMTVEPLTPEETIVATSVAEIGAQLKIQGSLSWITTSYLLTSTIFQPIIGRLGVRS